MLSLGRKKALQHPLEQAMNHIFALIFGVILSFGHGRSGATRTNDAFIAPEERTVDLTSNIPLSNHQPLLRKVTTNSYSEDACLSSCRLNPSSTNNTSQPQLLLRAPR